MTPPHRWSWFFCIFGDFFLIYVSVSLTGPYKSVCIWVCETPWHISLKKNRKNRNAPTSVYSERTKTNPFVSESFETSFVSCFGYIESKPVSQNTLVSLTLWPIKIRVASLWLTRIRVALSPIHIYCFLWWRKELPVLLEKDCCNLHIPRASVGMMKYIAAPPAILLQLL
jgi:hypothetical protein